MRTRVLFLLLAIALSPRSVSADPVRVTDGRFVLDIEGDIFNFTSPNLSFATTEFLIYATKSFARCATPGVFPCFSIEQEGQVIDWSFQSPGDQLLGTGTATVDGVTTSNVDFFGSMEFNVVPMPLSPNGSLDFDFIAPFSFEAMIRGLQGGNVLFANSFTGSGFVSINYEGSGEPGVFGFADESIVYQFEDAAVPEPGTLLLLASGLLAGAVRRSRAA